MSMPNAADLFEEPHPTRWSETQIARAAEGIALKLGFEPGKSDIRDLVTDTLGGTMAVDDWKQSTPTGMIQVRGPGDFTIWLSPYTAPARDTFTIAHELGHYFLHSKIGKRRIEVKREGDGPVEWEANCFAAAFLLPEAAFRQEWKRLKGDKWLLASRFSVSASVIEIRAKRLKLTA